jgi:hypothetical protein
MSGWVVLCFATLQALDLVCRMSVAAAVIVLLLPLLLRMCRISRVCRS